MELYFGTLGIPILVVGVIMVHALGDNENKKLMGLRDPLMIIKRNALRHHSLKEI